MKVGIVSPQLGQQATKENVLQTAMIAENEGIDSLWVGERLLWPLNPQTPSPGSADGSLSVELQIVLDPLETLTYIAANTNKMILGTSVIELRKWNTNFRGKFLIHASKNVNKEKCKSLGIDYNKQNTGTIIGRAILYDVKKHDNKTELMGDKNRVNRLLQEQ